MSIVRLTIDGFGQVELNNAAFRRDGRVEAQCAPKASDFASIPVENGMLLNVDAAKHEVALCTNTASKLPIALVYSAEHIYDEKTGLKNFKLAGAGDFLPRLGYLAKGDKFTENCIAYDTTEFATESALISALTGTSELYGGVSAVGAIKVSATAPTFGPVLRVVAKTTMPDGQLGVKFQVIAD